jgi:hypothetical protein
MCTCSAYVDEKSRWDGGEQTVSRGKSIHTYGNGDGSCSRKCDLYPLISTVKAKYFFYPKFVLQFFIVGCEKVVSGFSTAGTKFMSIVRRSRMVSSGDNEIYTGSGLRGVIPYVQCVVVVCLSQVCS